jgi:hypothetical protein
MAALADDVRFSNRPFGVKRFQTKRVASTRPEIPAACDRDGVKGRWRISTIDRRPARSRIARLEGQSALDRTSAARSSATSAICHDVWLSTISRAALESSRSQSAGRRPSPDADEERFIAIYQTLSAGPYEADICSRSQGTAEKLGEPPLGTARLL